MDRHQAQGARRGRLQTLDLPGVRDRLRDPPEDPSPRRAARLPPDPPPGQDQARALPPGDLRHPPGRPRRPAQAAPHRQEDLRAAEGRARLPGGITQVKEAVARYRRHHAEVFVPLSHPPGEAQFDFGFATVKIAGIERKAACAVMCLPYSDAFLVQAYPRECTETFQAAHTAAFSFFGGVPTKISYDNTSIAVRKIVGRDRELTQGFLRLESHFLFRHRFCTVGRGNEKGVVEGLVGYSRRNFMVPVPEAPSFAELNDRLRERCRADLDRRLWGEENTKATLLEEDRSAMLPTAFAHHELTVAGGIEEVLIASLDRVVATHPRCWEKERTVFDPRHYLALLERKPGALDVARPLEAWELPGCFALLRRRLEADLGWAGTAEFIKVLRLLEHASVGELATAVGQALSIGATAPEAIELILRHRAERPVALFSLDHHPHLRPYHIDPPDLSAYASLKGA